MLYDCAVRPNALVGVNTVAVDEADIREHAIARRL